MNDTKYISEEEAMDFLRLKETSMRTLVKKKLLGRYQIGVRYFYDVNEIMQLIEAGKKHEQSKEELRKYELALHVPPIRWKEHQFIITKAKLLLSLIEDIGVNKNHEREFDVLKKCISYSGNFQDVAEEYSMTKERIRQIFETGLKRFKHRCLTMKYEYDTNYADVRDENINLRKINAELQELISNLPENKKEYIENITSKRSILSTPIGQLDLSTRTLNCMQNCGIKTLGEITSYGKHELLRFRNFGKKSLAELEYVVKKHGLTFGYKYT